MTYKKIRIRATGQVTDMVPDVARAMISSGIAVDLSAPKPDSMQTQPAERAMKPAAAARPRTGRRAS